MGRDRTYNYNFSKVKGLKKGGQGPRVGKKPVHRSVKLRRRFKALAIRNHRFIRLPHLRCL